MGRQADPGKATAGPTGAAPPFPIVIPLTIALLLITYVPVITTLIPTWALPK